MKNKICYRCKIINNIETPLLSNGAEHIIQNSLGGRLTSKDLLCDDCNQHYGKTIDEEVKNSNQIHTQLGLKTQRNVKRSIKTPIDADGIGYTITSKNKIEPRYKGNKNYIFNNPISEKKFQKNNPNAKRAPNNYEPVGYCKETGKIKYRDFVFDDYSLFLKGILKIAVNFYVYKGGDFFWISDVIKALEVENKDHLKFIKFFPCKLGEVYKISESELSHVLYLYSNPKFAQLNCFIELYNCYSYIIEFSSRYYGPPIEESHCIDLITLDKSSKVVNTNNTPYNKKEDYYLFREEKTQRINRVFSDRLKSFTEENDRIVSKNAHPNFP